MSQTPPKCVILILKKQICSILSTNEEINVFWQLEDSGGSRKCLCEEESAPTRAEANHCLALLRSHKVAYGRRTAAAVCACFCSEMPRKQMNAPTHRSYILSHPAIIVYECLPRGNDRCRHSTALIPPHSILLPWEPEQTGDRFISASLRSPVTASFCVFGSVCAVRLDCSCVGH